MSRTADAMPEDRARHLLAKLEALKLPEGRRCTWVIRSEVGLHVEIGPSALWVDTENGTTVSLSYWDGEDVRMRWDGPIGKVEAFVGSLR